MNLTHTLYEPTGSGPHPTLVALHGYGANANDLLALAPYLGGGALQMICPQGPLTVPIGPGMSGFGWFPLTGSGQLFDGDAIRRSADQVREFLADVARRYAIDPRKLVLAGFSQGGVLAYRIALEEPTRFAGLVALSSWLPPPLVESLQPNEARRQLPTLVQHGSRDEVINVARARQSVESLRDLGVPVTYREHDIGHEIDAATLGALVEWLDEKVISPVLTL